MVTRTTSRVYDDIDGREITNTGGGAVTFTLRGITYELDLSPANVAKFEKAIKPFVEAAAKLNRARPQGLGSSGAKEQPVDRSAAIRAWARSEGYGVSERGRLRAEIVRAYDAAH